MTPLRPFTQAWADALRAAVNGDAGYRAAASGWAWPVALVLEPAPHLDYADETAVELVLEHGQCTAARQLDPTAVTAPFVLRAPYGVWKRLVRGTLDPLMAVGLRHVKVQGSLTTLLAHAGVAKALIACARTVPVHFPDEQP
ncbi:MAG: SCP2 sterol-binding domain-containing protein [Gemmatimonadaceae bacterium]|nr:SCP2 sterol-binding domain-containing protein [Gemmatimonadaceae bacterium]